MDRDATKAPAGSDARDVLHRKIDERCVGAFLYRRLTQLTPEQVQSARRWFVERIADRAIEIMKEKDDGEAGTGNS